MQFVPKIVAATEEIFSSMILLELNAADQVDLKTEDLGCYISAMIGLSGGFNAILGLHCPAAVGMAIGGAMLGMELEEVDEDTKDALGEITNMLAGSLKESFSTEGVDLFLAIPTTISGHSYKISAPLKSHRVLVPFDIEAGRFYIDLKYSLS